MNQTEIQQIAQHIESMDHPVAIRIVLTDHDQQEQFVRFGNVLNQSMTKYQIPFEKADAEKFPGIAIGTGIVYHAIVTGTELPPFLEAISINSAGIDAIDSEGVVTLVKDVQVPAKLEIFITPRCPFCPNAVRELIPLVLAPSRVQIKIIDGALFSELAESRGIRSAPTIVLNDRFQWNGTVDLSDIVPIINCPDPMKMDAEIMETLLLAGNANSLLDIMMDANQILPAFPHMLAHEQFTVRLAAMAMLEQMVEINKTLAGQVIDPLKELYREVNDQVRGDIIYVIGESGDDRQLPWLQSILAQTDHPELLDAVEEAMEKVTPPSV